MVNQLSTIYYSFKLLGAKYGILIFLSIALSIGLMLFAHGFLKGYEKELLVKIIGSSPHISVVFNELKPGSEFNKIQRKYLNSDKISLTNKGLIYQGTADISSEKVYDKHWVGRSRNSQSPEVVFKGMALTEQYQSYLSNVLIPFDRREDDKDKLNSAIGEIYTETGSRSNWDERLTYRKPIAFPPSLYRELLDPYIRLATYPFIRFPEIMKNFGETATADNSKDIEFVVVAALDTPISDETITIFAAYETVKHVFFGSAQGKDHFNYLELFLYNPLKASDFAKEIKGVLGENVSVSVWSDKYVAELGLITAFNFLLYSVMGGIGIAVGLLMSALLSISVRRKRRQISVFRALGAERRFVGNLFLYYSVVLGIVGFIGGMIIGHISGYFIWNFSTTDVEEYSNPLLKLLLLALKGIPQPEVIGILSATIIFLVTMAIAIASAYGPSLIAAGVDPVEGLRES